MSPCPTASLVGVSTQTEQRRRSSGSLRLHLRMVLLKSWSGSRTTDRQFDFEHIERTQYQRRLAMTYEYLCKKCGHCHEAQVPMRDRNTVPCPSCGADAEFQQIQLQSPGTVFCFKPSRGMSTMKETVAKHGPDWRETPGSLRIKSGEPERLYSFGSRQPKSNLSKGISDGTT